MLRIIAILILGTLLTSCSLFHVHKMDIEQGNIINPEITSQLHKGMSEAEVKAIMGNPVLVNTFSPDEVDYIYTMQKGYKNREEQRVNLTFHHGALATISP